MAEGLVDAGLSIWFDNGPRHADAGRELVAQSNEASRLQGQVALANQKTTTNVEQSYLSIQLLSVRKFTQLCLPLWVHTQIYVPRIKLHASPYPRSYMAGPGYVSAATLTQPLQPNRSAHNSSYLAVALLQTMP